jgi:Na+:H+ antiporter, NhaA family
MMHVPSSPVRLNDPVTKRMHQDFTQLRVGQTVGEALDWLRQNPPLGRVIYFYVVDGEGRLQGVVPTRRLVLSRPEAQLSDIMVGKTVVLPAAATVLDACEFFIQHRLLAFPVVDEQKRLLGVVDIDLYTNELNQLDRATALGRLMAPIARFLQIESAGGLVLLACTLAALVLANSALAEQFEALWQVKVGLRVGAFGLEKALLLWINDGLMTLFFFVVGLEIKREVVSGELSDPRKALLPVVAAVGGMVVPAAVYALILWGRPGLHGWGVPMATDIAFVVGFLTLLGPRVPTGLKIMLLTLAIADDIGAVLVIAVVYSTDIAFASLAWAGVGFGVILVLRWLGARSVSVYFMVGAGIWLAFLKSGVHPTVAGVLLGLLTPARPGVGRPLILDLVGELVTRMRGVQKGMPTTAPETESPAERLENVLHPWVAFAIMPVFALANAGVKIELGVLGTPIAAAVAAGLVLGKPLGIVLFSWVSVRLGIAHLPEGMNWKVVLGAGCLAGIGFTMSLFIAGLALDEALLGEAKIGVLAGSGLSAVLGCGLLYWFLPGNGKVGRAEYTTYTLP